MKVSGCTLKHEYHLDSIDEMDAATIDMQGKENACNTIWRCYDARDEIDKTETIRDGILIKTKHKKLYLYEVF